MRSARMTYRLCRVRVSSPKSAYSIDVVAQSMELIGREIERLAFYCSTSRTARNWAASILSSLSSCALDTRRDFFWELLCFECCAGNINKLSKYFAYCSPEDHHHIAQSQKDFHILSGWLSSHSDDPAIAVRIRQLQHTKLTCFL